MPTPRPVIVMLEKDPATREMYRRELAQEYEVFPCGSLTEARQILEKRAISVVVLEPVEFGQSGWGFFHQMKADPRSANIPVIVCSTQEVREAEIKNELAACLVKPVLPSELFLSVQQVLAKVLKA